MNNQEKEKRTEHTSLNNPGSNKPIQGMIIDCERLNVRSEPSMNGKIMCTLPKDSTVTVLDGGFGEWSKICTDSKEEAYAMSKYIKIVKRGD